MGELLLSHLDHWLSAVPGLEWLHFEHTGLSCFKFLRNLPVRPALLRAAVHFWDPDVHVFRFQGQELCPMVEEFSDYLGHPFNGEVIIPSLHGNMRGLLIEFLGISQNEARHLLFGRNLDIMRLMRMFSLAPGNEGRPWVNNNYHRHALLICLLAGYLLVDPFGLVDPAIIGVADDINDGGNPVPLILAETLMGLDKVHAGQTVVFGGAPILLQVWDFHVFFTAPCWNRYCNTMHAVFYVAQNQESWPCAPPEG